MRLLSRVAGLAALDPPLKGPRAYLNWIRSNLELRRGASYIGARPLKLTVDPTNACQLRCALCPTGLHLHDRGTGQASPRLFESLLDQLGAYVFFMDFFNWGEPLLNSHLEDYIEMAAARGIVCGVSTNLSLPLSSARIRRLVTCGLHEITVSLDGASQETYATYRRGGRLDLVLDNMRHLVAEKSQLRLATPVITWQFLVFRFNEHEIEKARAMAAEIGVEIAFRPPLVEVDRYPVRDKDPAAWRAANPKYQSAEEPRAAEEGRCAWHYMSAAVNWDGGIAPCCTLFEQRHDFGSVGPHGEVLYMQVQNNASYLAARDRMAGRRGPSGVICERCPTPSIRNLDRYLNRQIVLYTAAGALAAVRRLLSFRPSAGRLLPRGT